MPSKEDTDVTERGKILGIEVLDVIVNADVGYYYSMKEKGYI
ncbi:JAB domain-containing protein [Niallia sp. XMNu-256]